MNVLIYSGPDTAPTSFAQTLTSLRTLLVPNYAVQTVALPSLASHPWIASCALLVLPSFRAQGSGLTPEAAKGIQSYVSKGGRLLALGTGISVQRRGITSSLSLSALALSARIAGIALDDLSPGTTRSKLTLEDVESNLSFALTGGTEAVPGAESVKVQLADSKLVEGLTRTGTVDLLQASDIDLEASGIKTLAHILPSEGEGRVRQAVGLKVRIGRGSAVFWSVHAGVGAENEKNALPLIRHALEALGVGLPSQASTSAGPTPQILSAAPWRAEVVENILRTLGLPDLTQAFELKDSNDTFLIHSDGDGARIFSEQREAIANGISADPATWNPKHIVVYPGGGTVPQELTPRFSLAAYYEELARVRKESGCAESYTGSESWGVGEALLYGEVVTSTQTMLDKNTYLLTTFPTPLVSLASQQLTGRGRGTNVWLSPPGCLQFSLLLRVPLSVLPATKLVFVQYLFALAVTEACRSDGVLGPNAAGEAGVRIKWPNDLYAVTREGERKKIGGILVSTSLDAGKVEIVIGCGLNTLNPPPITSLAQLLPEGAARPTMERTLAAIMARFERMWSEFLSARGSFASFMDLYLDRWLHSDQLVTLTTVNPPREVRIVGITPDHGLLRTLPERGGWSDGGGAEYIDLQPDGNSFDVMTGLIKTKT